MEMKLNISKTSVHRILIERLDFRKVCSQFIPHKLIDDQTCRIQHLKDTIKETKVVWSFLYTIVAGDETWCFQYDLETKYQSAEWIRPDESNRKRKPRRKVKSEDNVDFLLWFEGNKTYEVCSTWPADQNIMKKECDALAG